MQSSAFVKHNHCVISRVKDGVVAKITNVGSEYVIFGAYFQYYFHHSFVLMHMQRSPHDRNGCTRLNSKLTRQISHSSYSN